MYSPELELEGADADVTMSFEEMLSETIAAMERAQDAGSPRRVRTWRLRDLLAEIGLRPDDAPGLTRVLEYLIDRGRVLAVHHRGSSVRYALREMTGGAA